jgi:hypothetical protein
MEKEGKGIKTSKKANEAEERYQQRKKKEAE